MLRVEEEVEEEEDKELRRLVLSRVVSVHTIRARNMLVPKVRRSRHEGRIH